MRIKPQSGIQSSVETASSTAPVKPVKSEKQSVETAQAPAPAASRSDKVQISDAGRALAARSERSERSASLSPERTAQIRQRVLDGAYDSLAVVDEVARRVLGSGDLA